MCDMLNLVPCGDDECGNRILFSEPLAQDTGRLQRHVREALHKDAVHRDALEQLAAGIPAEPPTVPGDVYGWRAWKVTRDGPPLLTSLYGPGGKDYGAPVWPTSDWFRAECWIDESHDCPAEGCTCGVHAALDLDHLEGLHRYGDPKHKRYIDEGGTFAAVGKIALAGRVVPGDRGWRAARARPVLILVAHANWRLGVQLAETYDCVSGVINMTRRNRGYRT